MRTRIKEKIILAVIFLIAAILRLVGTNWDQNQHLHPDERFLTMVATAIRWPSSISQYFDQATSPLNPANANFSFYVYGTFPLFFVKAVADILRLGDYTNITLIGRNLSAFFDLATLVVIVAIARKLLKFGLFRENNLAQIRWLFPCLAAFFYTVSVLPIQLSHYFAVDTFLVFFITLCFYLVIAIVERPASRFRELFPRISLLGIVFGLALACKISAVLFAPIIALGILYAAMQSKNWKNRMIFLSSAGLNGIVFTYFSFRLFNPYAFRSQNFFDITINPLFVNNLKTLESFNNPSGGFPPSLQWIGITPLLQLKTFLYYGVGLPLGLLTIIAIVMIVWRFLKLASQGETLQGRMMLAAVWIAGLFIYQSLQFAKPMRYLAPIYPFVALVAAYFSCQWLIRKLAGKIVLGLITVLTLIWSFMFVGIYQRTNTRVAASEWMYKNIPTGATLTCEHWDDCLPVRVPPKNGSLYPLPEYKTLELPLYNTDNEDKWQKITQTLNEADYIVLSSSRLYGSIMTVPKRYPKTYQFYQDLFNERLGFVKVAEFTSRPNIPLPFIKACVTLPFETYGEVAKIGQRCDLAGISIVDDYTDESYTVYDHPKVVIFKKI